MEIAGARCRGPRRLRVTGEDRHAKAQGILGRVHSTRGRAPVTGSLTLTRPSLQFQVQWTGLKGIINSLKTRPFLKSGKDHVLHINFQHNYLSYSTIFKWNLCLWNEPHKAAAVLSSLKDSMIFQVERRNPCHSTKAVRSISFFFLIKKGFLLLNN